MSCILNLNKSIKENFNDPAKPWFSYDENTKTVSIHEYADKGITLFNSRDVAEIVAASINDSVNNGEINVGKVAYVSLDDSGWSNVRVDPTDNQLNLLNSESAEAAEALRKTIDVEKESILLEERTQQEIKDIETANEFLERYGINPETGEITTTTVDNVPFFPKSVEESIKTKMESLIVDGVDSIFDTKSPIKDDGYVETLGEYNRRLFYGDKEMDSNPLKILERIEAQSDELSGDTRAILQKIKPILELTKAKVHHINFDELASEYHSMEYDADSNVIRIPKELPDVMSSDELVQTFLHEVVHSVTVNSLKNADSSITNSIYKNLIEDIFTDFKKLDRSGQYGFENIYEFVAEISTNPDFIAHFKSLESGNKSLWNRFVDAVRTLLGLKKSSKYEDVLKSIIDIAESVDREGLPVSHENPIFGKKAKKEDLPEKQRLTTATNKLDASINTILDRLDRAIYEYDKIIKSGYASENIQKYKNISETVAQEIESLRDLEKVEAVFRYIQFADEQLKTLSATVEKLDLSVENPMRVVAQYRSYMDSYSVLQDLQGLLEGVLNSSTTKYDKDIVREANDLLKDTIGVLSGLDERFYAYEKKLIYEVLKRPEYNTEVLKSWHTEIGKEYEGPDHLKEQWIKEQMEGPRKDEIDHDIDFRARSLIENVSYDIQSVTANIVSAENTNDKLIQNLRQLIERSVNKNNKENIQLDMELDEVFQRVISAKGRNIDPKKAYGHLIGEVNGKFYLLNRFKFEFKQEYEKRVAEVMEMADNGLPTREAWKKVEKWVEENTVVRYEVIDGEKTLIRDPKPKWANDLSKLSEIDKYLLEKAEEIFRRSDKQMFGINSLFDNSLEGVEFIGLPTITKDRVERLVSGEVKGALGDIRSDLGRFRAEDRGFIAEKMDRGGKPIYEQPIHYRGKLEDPSMQSYDLLTLMAYEGKNGNSFAAKNEIEASANLFLQVAKNRKYYQMSGDNPIIDRFSKRDRYGTKSGVDSNVYKRVNDIIETNIYDIFRHNMGQFNRWDVNKIIDFSTSWTAQLGMSVNTIGSTVNLWNGQAHFFLEAVSGHHLNFKNITKAKKVYMQDSINILRDTYSPVKKSYVNQVMKMFDTEGERGMVHDHRFVKSNFMRSKLNAGSLMTLQTAGEHWVQGTMTLGFLDFIKVMNKDSQYINKEGKPVNSIKEAASLLDMIKKGDDGIVRIDENVVFTSHTPYLRMDQGGKEMLNRFIKKKMNDTIGNYDPKDQGMLYKHGAGRLLLLFRRYLVPMFLAKYRGMKHVHKEVKSLEGKEKFFSEGLQEYEMGSYTAAVRVVLHGIKNMIREQKLHAFMNELSDMSPYEKRQARKGAVELLTITVVLPIISGLAAAIAKENEDEDNGFLWYVASSLTRLQTEMQSFVSPQANYRILKSPTAAMGVFDNAAELLYRVVTPWNWSEEYQTGPRAGRSKIGENFKNLTPILNRTSVPYKYKYDYLKTGTYQFFTDLYD